MPRSFTSSERDTIHKNLIFNGKKLFARYGLRKTTVEEIARKSGISKGAFYLFFSSKEQLFFEIIEQEELNMKRHLMASLPEKPSANDLSVMVWNAFSFAKSNPIIMHVFNPQEFNDLLKILTQNELSEHMNKDTDFANSIVNTLGFEKTEASAQIISGLLHSLFAVFLHKDEMEITDETFKKLISIVSNEIFTLAHD